MLILKPGCVPSAAASGRQRPQRPAQGVPGERRAAALWLRPEGLRLGGRGGRGPVPADAAGGEPAGGGGAAGEGAYVLKALKPKAPYCPASLPSRQQMEREAEGAEGPVGGGRAAGEGMPLKSYTLLSGNLASAAAAGRGPRCG